MVGKTNRPGIVTQTLQTILVAVKNNLYMNSSKRCCYSRKMLALFPSFPFL